MKRDEPKNGHDEAGGDGGNGLDHEEEPTLVLVSEDFVSGAIIRLGRSLCRAGLHCDELAGLVSSGASAAALADADADLADVAQMIDGARRAIARIKTQNGG